MKRFLLLAALSVASFACGSSDAESSDATGPAVDPGKRAPDAVGATPVDKDLDEEHGVFVSPTGKDTASGTREAPLATLRAAFAAIGTSGKNLYACEGTYAETIEVVNGVHMVGGLSCRDGVWAFGKSRSIVKSPTSPALRAKDVVALTRIEGFEVSAPDGNDANPSSIGLIAENANGLVLANMKITAGRGKDGVDGTNGTQLTIQVVEAAPAIRPALVPVAGLCGADIHYCSPRPGASGGSSQCIGADGFAPQNGGRGGSSGVWQTYNVGPEYHWEVPGYAPEARTGADGAAGADGASATSGAFDVSGYTVGSGTSGTNGSTGMGGSGGWAQVPNSSNTTPQEVPYNNRAFWAHEGAGGGAGGCPGLAGTAGTGGGASVAALLFDSAISVTASELVSSDGGAGGRGTLGSNATPGGQGGSTIVANAGGQPGGMGGRAGISGHGSGGPSFAIASHGAAPKVDSASKLAVGNGGLGRGAVTVGSGGYARTIPASASGEASELHSF